MLEYDYKEAVKEDVKDYLTENQSCIEDFAEKIDYAKINLNGDCEYFFEDLGDLKNELEDKLFIDDGVTGNASGSYTFNSNEAKEYVFSSGMEILKDAVNECYLSASSFVDYFTSENWEALDVICRCYVLYSAIDEAVDEWAESYAENNQDYLKQLYEEHQNRGCDND